MAVKKAPETQPEERKENIITLPKELKPQAVSKPQAAFYMYIGPSIRGVICANAVIRADALKRLDDALVKYPDIKHLLIPGEQLGAARVAIKKPDNFLAAIYNRLAHKA